MISVTLPHDVVYREVTDSESPWGTSEQFNPELWEWLQERDPAWDFIDHGELGYLKGNMIILVSNMDLALLLKLTWSGR